MSKRASEQVSHKAQGMVNPDPQFLATVTCAILTSIVVLLLSNAPAHVQMALECADQG